jgi:hypothetical protein
LPSSVSPAYASTVSTELHRVIQALDVLGGRDLARGTA